jgi:hypothetical protein
VAFRGFSLTPLLAFLSLVQNWGTAAAAATFIAVMVLGPLAGAEQGAVQPAGGAVVHHNITINALDARSVQDFFDGYSGKIRNLVVKAYRNGYRPR